MVPVVAVDVEAVEVVEAEVVEAVPVSSPMVDRTDLFFKKNLFVPFEWYRTTGRRAERHKSQTLSGTRKSNCLCCRSSRDLRHAISLSVSFPFSSCFSSSITAVTLYFASIPAISLLAEPYPAVDALEEISRRSVGRTGSDVSYNISILPITKMGSEGECV